MRSPTMPIAVAVLMVLAAAAPIGAQSPPGPVGSTASASPAASGPGVPPTEVGLITWTKAAASKAFKDFTPADVGQLPDGRLVTVGRREGNDAGAAMLVSDDGVSWKRLKAPKASAYSTIAAIGQAIVLIGQGNDGKWRAWTSVDGKKWSKGASLAGELDELTAFAGGLVGVGGTANARGAPAEAMAYVTSDGVTWMGRSLAAQGWASQVVAGPDRPIVAIGTVTGPDGLGTPAFWSSQDGVAWTQGAMTGSTAGDWFVSTAAWAPAGYVTSMTDFQADPVAPHVWWSPDGTAWTEVDVDATGSLGASTSLGTGVLLGGPGKELRSTDGRQWVGTEETTFDGWRVSNMTTLTDGRLVAAGSRITDSGGMGTAWVGTAEIGP